MNVELLRKIQAHNTAHPEQLDMSELLSVDCGTVACIAGHALLLIGDPIPMTETEDGKQVDFDEVWSSAIRLLGINEQESGRLFHGDNWPKSFLDRLDTRDTYVGSPGYAVIVNARIDHFIATEGAE